MRLLKIAAAAIAALVAGYLLLVNFSATESRFVCTGRMSAPREAPAKVFLKVHEYRWWVQLWSNSQGSLWLELPNTSVQYYGHVRAVGDQLQIFKNPLSIKGNLSKLSGALVVATDVGNFEGMCVAQ